MMMMVVVRFSAALAAVFDGRALGGEGTDAVVFVGEDFFTRVAGGAGLLVAVAVDARGVERAEGFVTGVGAKMVTLLFASERDLQQVKAVGERVGGIAAPVARDCRRGGVVGRGAGGLFAFFSEGVHGAS